MASNLKIKLHEAEQGKVLSDADRKFLQGVGN